MKKSSFIEGTFIATIAIILVKIMGMLYVIPFYAIVGVEGAALYAYAYNIYSIFLDISTVGLPIAMSKITNEFNTLKMYDAKARSYKIAINIMRFFSITIFLMLFFFASPIAKLIIGDLSGGNSIESITFVIRCVSLAILVIPYLSVTRGYLQGHNVINISSVSNILEQIIRIIIVLLGSYLVINVFKKSYVLGVGIALTGALFGGLVSYIYIKSKMVKNKQELSLDKLEKKDDITNKEILKKIMTYAIPYIIINCIFSVYSFTDMILIFRGLSKIGYETKTIEFIASSIGTWSSKIDMIIISIAMGMTTSLIPSIVNSFTLKKYDDVNKKINTSLKMITFISLPMAIGLSFLSSYVWQIFYGQSQIGSIILAASVFIGVCTNYYMITSSVMQSLNKYKIVYLSTLCGLLINASLDLPLIFLFNKIGIPPYIGTIVASMIGYSTTCIIALKSLEKETKKINFNESVKCFIKVLVPNALMILGLYLTKLVLPIMNANRLECIISIIIYSIIGASIYFIVSLKMNLFEEVFGKEMCDKYIKKLKHMFKH